MKKLISVGVYIILMLTAKTGFAQQEESQATVSNVLKLNFFLPGISYEQKIAKYRTLYFSGHLDAMISKADENINNQAQLFLIPSFNIEFRNYYNINKRKENSLRTALNSANYIAPLYIGRYAKTSYYSDHEWVNQVGAVWGIQRNSPKGFSIDLNLGLVYTFKQKYFYYYEPIEPIIQVELGFWIGRKSH